MTAPQNMFNAGLGDVGLGGYTDTDHDYVVLPGAAPAAVPENELDYTNPDA
jgi:hypothetical protein